MTSKLAERCKNILSRITFFFWFWFIGFQLVANRVIFDIGRVPFGIGHPHLHIKCTLHVCRRIQGSQIFKWNSIILIRSKVMAFLVILLSPHGPMVPTLSLSSLSSPHHPHHPHIIPIAARRSPCGLHGLWSPWSPWSPHVVYVVPMSSPSSSHRPCHPHII